MSKLRDKAIFAVVVIAYLCFLSVLAFGCFDALTVSINPHGTTIFSNVTQIVLTKHWLDFIVLGASCVCVGMVAAATSGSDNGKAEFIGFVSLVSALVLFFLAGISLG